MWGLKDCTAFNDSYNILLRRKVHAIVKTHVIGHHRENSLLKNARGLSTHIATAETILQFLRIHAAIAVLCSRESLCNTGNFSQVARIATKLRDKLHETFDYN